MLTLSMRTTVKRLNPAAQPNENKAKATRMARKEWLHPEKYYQHKNTSDLLYQDLEEILSQKRLKNR